MITGMPAFFASASAGATSDGSTPPSMITEAFDCTARRMPRAASAAENLPSKPTPLAPTSLAPCLMPCAMYCSNGMLRLSETYQIDLPFALEASNGAPGGFQAGAFEYSATAFCASAMPAARESRCVELADAAATHTARPAMAMRAAMRLFRP